MSDEHDLIQLCRVAEVWRCEAENDLNGDDAQDGAQRKARAAVVGGACERGDKRRQEQNDDDAEETVGVEAPVAAHVDFEIYLRERAAGTLKDELGVNNVSLFDRPPTKAIL